jgi:hypothetical protein
MRRFGPQAGPPPGPGRGPGPDAGGDGGLCGRGPEAQGARSPGGLS